MEQGANPKLWILYLNGVEGNSEYRTELEEDAFKEKRNIQVTAENLIAYSDTESIQGFVCECGGKPVEYI